MGSHFRVHTWSGMVDCYFAFLIVMAELNAPKGEVLHLMMASPMLYDINASGTTTFTCFRSTQTPPYSRPLNLGIQFSIRFTSNGTTDQSSGTLVGETSQSNNRRALTVSNNATYGTSGLYSCNDRNNVNSFTPAVYSITHTRRGKLEGFYFNSGTLIVNAGEDVTLPILSTDDNEVDSQVFRFRSNTSLFFGNKIKIASYEVQHGDVYGARLTGPNEPASLIRVIVRVCSAGRWGPPSCTDDCDPCYNGGVCDDKTGQCICAPGFSGTNCSNACGKHKFGWNCEFECGPNHTVENCTGTQFSLPDPYGSSCISGYSGRDCNIECLNGMYGAGCTQTCRCRGSNTCDKYTGWCIDTGVEPNPYILLIVVSSVSGIFVIVLLLALINECCHRRGKTSSATVSNTDMRDQSRHVPSPILAHRDTANPYTNVVVGIPSWAMQHCVDREFVHFGTDILSIGNFGEVTGGSVTKNGTVHEATISRLKATASPTDNDKFMTAFGSMTRIGNHPNLVNILGVCTHDDDLCVALEFMPYGNLRSHLRRSRLAPTGTFPSSETLLTFALDVAKGMQHLAMNKIVHQDLAARNILLDGNLVAKISDFGLSRVENTYLDTTTFQKRVSFRWKPLEALNTAKHSSMTDVWSFGVLLWEIVTLGATPYSDIPTSMLVSKLKSGYRLPNPSYCSLDIYELMHRCWNVTPRDRPKFRKLVEILSVCKTLKNFIRLSSTPGVKFYEICPELDDN
ncbi:uncharacterized protein [Asterias amurensis]|uniref:uncharacterized protein n=1 Tax=Asterias amurensis TaxID=7602 RepID=UPI003AB5AA25